MLVYQRVHSSFMKCWLQKSELAMGGFWEKHRTTKRWDFPAAVWPFPIWNDTFFHLHGSVKHDSSVLVDWSMGDLFPVFTKHVTVKDSQDYTRSFLIHLKKIYIPYSSTSEKKNSKPLWCHQTWKIPELNRRIIELNDEIFHVSHDLKVYGPRYRKLYPLVMTNSLLAGTWP